MRKAEQRWPAESKADDSTSTTTCSASAEESTTIALRPPVSAISGIGAPRRVRRPASVLFDQPRDRRRAGEHDALDAWIGDQRRADLAGARHELQRVARERQPHAARARLRAAMSGVSSAGLAITELPAASAAATWPVKIASGKFQGLMQTTRPSGQGSRGSNVRAASCA